MNGCGWNGKKNMKKRKIIDLPKPTMDMLARCAAVLKPPPELTLSEWEDKYRVLSAESSAEPGRWHTDKAPYQREIMDAIGDPHIRKVVIMSAAQIGKTDAFILNPLGYYMDYAPAPILVMQPTLDMGQTFSKDRLAPMIRDTPELRDKVDVKSRYSGNTIMKKNFPGGHITIVGANSATGLASRPIKVLLADEVDRYPASAGTEGDPLSLAQKRQTTFWDKKTVIVSTPVIKGQSRIETEFEQSTKEEWNVPCPDCGHYQPFVWANVIFDRENPQGEVLYKCERCGVVSGEYQWKQASKRGRFVAENPAAEARGALNEFWRTCGMQRDWFADDFCQPVYEEWFTEAVARGRISAPGYFSDPAIRKAYTACSWNGPARTNLNPVQEVTAAIKRVEACFSTAQEETAQMTGGDYNRNIKQRVMEAKRKREVDIIGSPDEPFKPVEGE